MKGLSSAFLVFFSFLIIIPVYAVVEQQGYTSRTLVDARWGTAQDEFGLQTGEEIETVGPLTFTLDDEGSIYIFDTINKQVKKFNAKGVYLENVLDNVSGTAMCVDSNENLYLLEDHIIQHYSKDGAPINTYQVSKNINLIEGYGQGLFFDKAGNLFVNRIQAIYQIATLVQIGRRNQNNSSLKLLSSNQQVWSIQRGIPGSSVGGRFATNWLDNRTATIQVLSDNGAISKEILMRTPDVFGTVLFLKQDNQGAIYIETERITPDNYIHLEVRKYNPYKGNLLTIIELPNDYFTTVYKKIHVDNQGNIYQLLTTPSGVKLIQWQQKLKKGGK